MKKKPAALRAASGLGRGSKNTGRGTRKSKSEFTGTKVDTYFAGTKVCGNTDAHLTPIGDFIPNQLPTAPVTPT